MKKAELRAFRTLIRIRIRRQESLDKTRVEAQQELTRLIDVAAEAEQTRQKAEENVASQIRLINKLTEPGSQFQIADYLAQEDYRSFLIEKAALEQTNVDQANAAIVEQETVLSDARRAANANIRQRERLEERVELIMTEIGMKKMDDEDEEIEESVVTRKLLKIRETTRNISADTND